MKSFEDILEEETKFLDKKAPHTKYKIKYVKEYVVRWTYIACCSNADNINFIDCMCNAGIYRDGDFCSSIEVLRSFVDIAFQYPNKKLNLFLNDNDKERIRILKKVINKICPKRPLNLRIFVSNMDVNDYFSYVLDKYCLFAYPSRTILYVDPYDFHTVMLDKMTSFVSSVYCEVIFNLFTSDYLRNKNDSGIEKVLGGKFDFSTCDELTSHVRERLTINKMKYCFAYPFKISKNVELYRILFITPNIKGLDVFKNILWGLFDGDSYYRTDIHKEQGQTYLFSNNEKKDMAAKYYASEAQVNLIDTFAGTTISFNQIASLTIENSLLVSSQVLEYVVKPLIKQEKIIKNNIISKTNYKDDKYTIKVYENNS